MLDILLRLWPWILGCFAVGGATGYLVGRPAPKRGVAAWLVWAGLAFLAAIAAALIGLFAGRAGVSLETAVAAFAAFLGGSAGGTLARGGSLREHEGWAVGLVPAGLLWFGANHIGVPDYEATLRERAGAEIARAGVKIGKIEVDGRDVTVATEPGFDANELVSRLARLDGVRAVQAVEGEIEVQGDKPADKGASAARTAEEAGDQAAGAGKGAAEKPPAGRSADAARGRPDASGGAVKKAEKPTGAADRPKKAAETARADPGASAIRRKKAADVLASLPKTGDLDAAACQSALAAVMAQETIQFRVASVSIRLDSARALDRLVSFIQRCPNAKIEVAGHTDSVGDDDSNRELSQRRADAVVGYLEREGVARGRLTGVGYGASRPIASNDDEDGRAANRRIEFIVK
jgi:outer membrane protein OmpA-like peptidoglycan-associated protein